MFLGSHTIVAFFHLYSVQVYNAVSKWRSGTGLWWTGAARRDAGDRRQSVSRQPSFTLSEWTDAQEDLLDIDPVPQTPVFEIGNDIKTEADAATLTVTPVGLQERSVVGCETRRAIVASYFWIRGIEAAKCIGMTQHVSHRRGSNVSLTLDMCTPGCTEPYGYGGQLSPRDQTAKEYLRQGTNSLTPAMLHTRAVDDQSLQAEFYVSTATAAHPPTHFRSTD